MVVGGAVDLAEEEAEDIKLLIHFRLRHSGYVYLLITAGAANSGPWSQTLGQA
jgi:hypothetical protein